MMSKTTGKIFICETKNFVRFSSIILIVWPSQSGVRLKIIFLFHTYNRSLTPAHLILSVNTNKKVRKYLLYESLTVL